MNGFCCDFVVSFVLFYLGSACLCLLNARMKSMCHHARQKMSIKLLHTKLLLDLVIF